MNEVTRFEGYPDILQVKHVKEILGISNGNTYALFKKRDFPTIQITEKRMVVLNHEFYYWLLETKRKVKRTPIITNSR